MSVWRSFRLRIVRQRRPLFGRLSIPALAWAAAGGGDGTLWTIELLLRLHGGIGHPLAGLEPPGVI